MPKRNIGLVTGEVSGITVLDIDVGPDKEGGATWEALTREDGEPQTLHAITGSGGMHWVFKYNSALTTSSNTLGDGVDCRNDKNGYICASPSLHRSGGSYGWANWSDPPVIEHLPKHLSQRKERRGRKKKDDLAHRKLGIEQVATMLDKIPADDRELWRKVGTILGREFVRSDAAWKLYNKWSEKWQGKKARNHDQIMHEAFYEKSKEADGAIATMGTIVMHAKENGWAPQTGSVPVESFLYYAPGNNFVYLPTCAFWPAESVDAGCSKQNEEGELVKASAWLKRHNLVTSMTNDPAIDAGVLPEHDYRDGVAIPAKGAATYNAYRPPLIDLGDASKAKPYIEHVHKVFPLPGDAEMFLNYMAHRVQRPGEKVRFALLIGGEQGVGKDTAISMAYPAIGVWNVANIEPSALDQGFNEHEAAVLVVVSEAANQHEGTKFTFNERTKVLIAGLPDFVTINPKYGHKYTVRRHSGVIITSNHITTAFYIPRDDRRFDVIESATRSAMGLEDRVVRADYFDKLWGWFHGDDGARHVAALLHARDLKAFNPNTGQRLTAAHRLLVNVGQDSDSEVTEALEELENPPVLRVDVLFSVVQKNATEMTQKEFAVRWPHAAARLGYRKLLNPDAIKTGGRWSFNDNGKQVKAACYYDPARGDEQTAMRQVRDLKHKF